MNVGEAVLWSWEPNGKRAALFERLTSLDLGHRPKTKATREFR